MSEALAIVTIRNNETGETRVHTSPRNPEYDDGIIFSWAENNYSCDCNRATIFAEAGGEEDPDRDCSDGAFTVLSITDECGRILYDGDKER